MKSVDHYIGATKQLLPSYAAAATVTSSWWVAQYAIPTAQPGQGTVAGSSTAAGVVPTSGTPGFLPINAFSGAARGYLTRVMYGNQTAARKIALFDMLWKGGAYAFNANVSLSGQPSYASRIPQGDYGCTELYLEAVTGFTGNLTVTIGYNDQDGNSSTTGAYATGVAPAGNRWVPIPFASGDCGIQRVNSVLGAVSSAGTFNIVVVRKLWVGWVHILNSGGDDTLFDTGMPEIYDDSALLVAHGPDLGLNPEMLVEIASY